MKRTFTISIAVFLLGAATWGATITVPGMHATIQDAIGAAATGDTVVVSPGTYLENIDFLGKRISVVSSGGAGATVIDGGQAGRVVTFENGERQDSVIDGFTITNGLHPNNGAGIFCYAASPTIRNNVIADNTTTDNWSSGGGIFCDSFSSPVIRGNRIVRNTVDFRGAGILCANGGLPLIEGNVISDNHPGGIVVATNTDATIANNIVTGNTGSGINILERAYPTITGNWIADNVGGHGAGINCCLDCSALIEGNVITGNRTDYGGGGGVSARFNCVVTLVNNTICQNSSIYRGGGVFSTEDSTVTIVNSIIWYNVAPNGPELAVGESSSSATLIISDSVVKHGQPMVHVEPGATLNWGAGMSSADPLFFDERNGDFHLTWPSPCRDAGSNAAVTASEDFEGDPRIAAGTVDIGADEFYFHIAPELPGSGPEIPANPGQKIKYLVAGPPGLVAHNAVGGSLLPAPYGTSYGNLHIWPFIKTKNLGPIPSSGILSVEMTVPMASLPGDEFPIQTLVGSPGGPVTCLTNYLLIRVE